MRKHASTDEVVYRISTFMGMSRAFISGQPHAQGLLSNMKPAVCNSNGSREG